MQSSTSRPTELIPSPFILIAAAGILICRISYLGVLALVSVADRQMSDFGLFYYGLHAWLQGGSFYLPNAASYWMPPVVLRDLAPPHLHLLIWPLAYLPREASFWSWLTLNALSFGISVRIVLRELGVSTAPEVVLPLLAFLSMTQAAHTTWLGQYDWLLMLPATLAWRAIRNERWTSGFAYLGIILSFKPFPLVFLGMVIAARRWREPWAMLAVAATIAAVGVVVFGMRSYVEWLNALRQGALDLGWMWDSLSLSSTWIRAFSRSPMFTPIVNNPAVATVGATVTAVMVLTLTWRRVPSLSVDAAIAHAWLAGFLVAPISWSHYLALTFAPLFAVALSGGWIRRPSCAIVVVAMVFPTSWVPLFSQNVWTVQFGAAWACWVALSLWALVYMEKPADRHGWEPT